MQRRTSISSRTRLGADGKPLRPHFDTVLPILLDLFKANPQRNLAEAYDPACWSHPEVRKQLLAAEQMRQQSRHDVEKAKNAQRGNTQGPHQPCGQAAWRRRAFAGIVAGRHREVCRRDRVLTS